jgi:serine/threonine protein kinase
MSVIPVTSQMQYLQCRYCNALLPIHAIFCGKCGMRIDEEKAWDSNALLPDQNDIAARYRITSLIRRRTAIQLSFAFDMRLQSLVVVRDIDISELDQAARKLAYVELQREYDLLRCQPIIDVTPLIALHYSKGHLYSVSGRPFLLDEQEATVSPIRSARPYTLYDLLQSGIGLPKERIAVSWIRALALAVECLHESQIVIGELDPDTIIMSSHDHSGQPALMVSWIPTTIRHALSQTSNMAYPSSFRAPETFYGQEDNLSDVYSLGALLYLLLTGIAPDPIGSSNRRGHYRQRAPCDLNSSVSSALNAVVMQALAIEPEKRFQSAGELGDALLSVQKGPPLVRRPIITFGRRPKSTPNVLEEIPVSSDMNNNESSMGEEAQHNGEPNDETIQLRDIQVQLARRYLSGINTGPLSSQEKQTGEVTVDEIYVRDKQTEDTAEVEIASSQVSEEILTNKDEQIKKKKRSHRKSRGVNGRASEKANHVEAQDEMLQAAVPSVQVTEVLAESSNGMSLREVVASTPAEEDLTVVSSGEGTVEMQSHSELVEPEQSLEEEVSVREEQVQVEQEGISHGEEQLQAEQEVTQREEAAQEKEEQLQAGTEVVVQEEQVQVEQERIAHGEEQLQVEQEITQREDAAQEKEEQLQAGTEVVVQEEQVQVEQERIAHGEEQLQVEQEITQREEAAQEKEEQLQAGTEVVAQEEQAQVEQERIAHGEEQLQAEAEVVAQEEIQVEQEVIQQEEEPQSESSQEGHVVSTSQALLPLSILPSKSKNRERGLTRIKDLFIGMRSLLAHQTSPIQANANQIASFLKRVQRFILGEQKHTTMAAALIETPMRIQPTQSYAIRIQIIGRDQFTGEARTGGLSALVDGDIVHIEVRLALYKSYAYVVQQADVAIPASGYAAEMTVPMHPLASGPSSRRERLQIFFMDKERNPLYEKPFVIEIFVSPLVQIGNEGHNVLSIPV